LYTIVWEWSAWRELESLAPGIRTRIEEDIDRLAGEPRPQGARKLTAGGGQLRIRVGRYRILYTIDDKREQVIIGSVGHRREVYR
jgi:mRNA interferase RelE/StbE